LLWQLALAVLPFALGGWSWVVWGIVVRLVVTYHIMVREPCVSLDELPHVPHE